MLALRLCSSLKTEVRCSVVGGVVPLDCLYRYEYEGKRMAYDQHSLNDVLVSHILICRKSVLQ